MIKLNFTKRFSKDFTINVNLEMETGSSHAFIGESGAGKTSLLKLIAGIEKIDRGEIKMGQILWNKDEFQLPLEQRNIGFVFQNSMLFPNMTVEENIYFGAGIKKRNDYLSNLIEQYELEELLKQKPYYLSGGQKQRVALVRALAKKPKILFLDEPFSALDKETRKRMQVQLKKYLDEYKCTSFIVSHSTREVSFIADNFYFVEKGNVSIFNKAKAQSWFKIENINGTIVNLSESNRTVTFQLSEKDFEQYLENFQKSVL